MEQHHNEASEVDVVHCQSFDDFIKRIRPRRMVMERIYRGQRDADWKLQSLWERWLANKRRRRLGPANMDKLFSAGSEGRVSYRDEYLRQFRNRAALVGGLSRDVLSNDNELWALGRHHGLVTPLLDWTRSPFVAAFFAFFDLISTSQHNFRYGPGFASERSRPISDATVAVWELNWDQSICVLGEFEIFQSMVGSGHRQRAQSGLFTLLNHSRFVDLEAYLSSVGRSSLLRRYEIPGTAALDALSSLQQMNITYATLFPDLDGAALDANLSWFYSSIDPIEEP